MASDSVEAVDAGGELDEEDLVVVVVRRNTRFHWFRSPREPWVLDRLKWKRAFEAAGYSVPDSALLERFGIAVVDDQHLDEFLLKMNCWSVTKEALRDELISRIERATAYWDVADLFPIMFVDADQRRVSAFYCDGPRLELYAPDGWISEFADFLADSTIQRLSDAEKFWIDDGEDHLAELNRRGER